MKFDPWVDLLVIRGRAQRGDPAACPRMGTLRPALSVCELFWCTDLSSGVGVSNEKMKKILEEIKDRWSMGR